MNNYIRPLTIGNLTFAHNLIQGPLAGYSCAPFRKLFYNFRAPAYCCTEMISAQDLVQNKHTKKRFVFRDPLEKFLCYQLGGYDINYLRDAALKAVDWGADLIDLNCGCPKPKIRKKRMGSFLLEDPEHIARIVETLKKVTNVPITVKIRVDKPSIAKRIADAGADAIIVHGRHWTEDYDAPCQLSSIAEIVAAVTIPVIGNGDVSDLNSLKQMFETTQCAGVMISRAGTGKPWIYDQLLTDHQNFLPPALEEIKLLFFAHLSELASLENETLALLQSRKLFKYYFKNYSNIETFTAYCLLKNLADVQRFLELNI